MKIIQAIDYTIPAALVAAVAEWLDQKGIDQWQAYLDGKEDGVIREAVEKGETYLVYSGDQPVATYSISEELNDWDRAMWGEGTHPRRYYVHRVAIVPQQMGSGIGQEIMKEIERQAKKAGIPAVRLDCVENNHVLHRFYESCGYKQTGTARGARLYEKSVAD